MEIFFFTESWVVVKQLYLGHTVLCWPHELCSSVKHLIRQGLFVAGHVLYFSLIH